SDGSFRGVGWGIGEALLQRAERLEGVARERAAADHDVGLATHAGEKGPHPAAHTDAALGEVDDGAEGAAVLHAEPGGPEPAHGAEADAVALVGEGIEAELDPLPF